MDKAPSVGKKQWGRAAREVQAGVKAATATPNARIVGGAVPRLDRVDEAKRHCARAGHLDEERWGVGATAPHGNATLGMGNKCPLATTFPAPLPLARRRARCIPWQRRACLQTFASRRRR